MTTTNEKTLSVAFGEVTANEINTMLTASAESGEAIAQAILDKQGHRNNFANLTIAEAEYLRDNLWGDADRVAMGVSTAAGRAFENAGNKLSKLINAMFTPAEWKERAHANG